MFFLIPPPPPINRFAQNNYLRLAFKFAVYAGFLGFLLGREEVVEWTRKLFQQNYGASLVAAVAAAATPEAGIDGVGALRWYRLCGWGRSMPVQVPVFKIPLWARNYFSNFIICHCSLWTNTRYVPALNVMKFTRVGTRYFNFIIQIIPLRFKIVRLFFFKLKIKLTILLYFIYILHVVQYYSKSNLIFTTFFNLLLLLKQKCHLHYLHFAASVRNL